MKYQNFIQMHVLYSILQIEMDSKNQAIVHFLILMIRNKVF